MIQLKPYSVLGLYVELPFISLDILYVLHIDKMSWNPKSEYQILELEGIFRPLMLSLFYRLSILGLKELGDLVKVIEPNR